MPSTETNTPNIPGLKYFAEYLDDAEEAGLLQAIDAEPWRNDLKRRVQHYGWRYDYKAHTIDPSAYLGPLPTWTKPLVERLIGEGHMSAPDQLIVNEYAPGQGISAHVDCPECFGTVICSMSLGSSCVMELSSVDGRRQESLLLERRSLLALGSDSRKHWRHEIPRRKAGRWDGCLIPRSRRVSLTFRTVVIRFYRASGPWGFLSNLYPCEVRFEGRTFESAEHAYQFGKPRDPAVAEWLLAAPSASLCAQVAHAFLPRQVHEDWSEVKVPRMRAVLLAKFDQNPKLADRLRATSEAQLIEESRTDAFWGVGRKGTGKNMLGTLLMETRAALRTRIE
jgi:ribA/ribD-fused uncharacterized protein